MAWLLFLLMVADSPWSIVRAALPETGTVPELRVVSLNCASFAAAANEVGGLQPDIVLLQESPSKDDLAMLAESVFGAGNHLCWDVDTSILARGEVISVDVPERHRQNFVHARVRTETGVFNVISLRLIPNLVRVDLWSPNCWAAHRKNHLKRERQLKTIVAYLATIPREEHVVLGGDFNAPPNDAVFRLLRPRLQDSFRTAGRGWGASITNEYPMIRIDQIWHSEGLRPITVRATRSSESDHRIVVGDFAIGQ